MSTTELDYWIVLFFALGAVSLYYARLQPFPEFGNRFGWCSLGLGLIFLISRNAPRDTAILAPAVTAAVFGGLTVMYGVRHMVVTKKDVLVAPFGGVLLCIGTVSLMSDSWNEMDSTYHLISFVTASVVVMLEIYLAFRGLVVGVQGITWSKSGLRQVSRGLLLGPRGAISHFERSWDMDDQWLNAMSHAALALIHKNLGDEVAEKEHIEELQAIGGWSAVDSTWIETIEGELVKLKAPRRVEEE
ncbi:MAG: hypothetical protein VYB30_05060 [Candidatus Thermoplasmatota archaeon]|nr:hypothetical protein [Candidatus Thermoplasmatota archaeon]